MPARHSSSVGMCPAKPMKAWRADPRMSSMESTRVPSRSKRIEHGMSQYDTALRGREPEKWRFCDCDHLSPCGLYHDTPMASALLNNAFASVGNDDPWKRI